MNTFNFIETWDRNLDSWVGNNGLSPYVEPGNISASLTENNVQLKTPFLKEKAQIEKLELINGLSISEIEARASPGEYSFTGFIGIEESFKEVLRKDWETVEKLQVTHSELAAHLTNIISIAESIERSSKKGSSASIVIKYKTNDLENNSILSEAPQKLEVILMGTKGIQKDLFEPKYNSEREVDTPKGWNEENIIMNPTNGVKLYINSGILNYIHEFGFYEGGGDQNRYRVDPLKVMALLTGK